MVASIALLAGLGFGGMAGWRWWQKQPKSVAGLKREIRGYIKKQTGQRDFTSSYDFNLRATVATLQTNAVKLRGDAATLRTNLVTAQRDSAGLTRETEAARDEERAARRAVASVTEQLAERQRRLALRETELTLVESNVSVMLTHVAALQSRLLPLETNAVVLSNEVSAAQAAWTAAGTGTNQAGRAGLRQALATRQQEAAVLRQKLNSQRAEVTQREARLHGLQSAAASAQTNRFSTQTNVTAITGDLQAKQALLSARQQAAAEKQSVLTARQGEVKALQAAAAEKDAALTHLRREHDAKDLALSYQAADFSRHIRTNVNAAASYEVIYANIGRMLWTTDGLLAGSDPALQRQGVLFAETAADYAARDALNGWLAARICEAYLWPNLACVERGAPPAAAAAVDAILQTCGDNFSRAGEPRNVVKNLKLRLARAQNEQRADSLRVYLGDALEQTGDAAGAVAVYRAVQHSNHVRQAQQRIRALEQKRTAKN